MSIAKHIENVKERLRRGEYTSEAAVSQGIVLKTLNELNWPVFDTSIVIPEYSLENRRVDYALCHPANRPSVFIEVKKVGFSDGADRQLFEYAFHLGVPMAILTDGQEWSFYLPGEQGRYDERRVYKLDLLERDVEEAVSRLQRYLQYQRVCSGESLRSAREDYQNVARGREVENVLPKAWLALLEEPDSLLLELLAEKAEDLCGYKPDLDACSRFLARSQPQASTVQIAQTVVLKKPQNPVVKTEKSSVVKAIPPVTLKPNDSFSYVIGDTTYQANSAREVMIKIFQYIAKQDTGFLDRYASRKHGKKRRYLAKNKFELYPGRTDLCEEHSIEVMPGWWIGVNYSRVNIQQIIDLALEVARPNVRGAIKVNVL
ncbi:hypothetical protein [Rheinheimera sp.]|uniref:hypothetical protein n=1 Tax=Rheinheimera sp. TaxID=1869214 RepID=UPI002FDD741F